MGTRRLASYNRRLIRITKALEDRDTLIPCEACGKSGHNLLEKEGIYRQVECNWCQDGYTDRETAGMLQRWFKIRQANPNCS